MLQDDNWNWDHNGSRGDILGLETEVRMLAQIIFASNFNIMMFLNAGVCFLFVLWQIQQFIVFGALRREEQKAMSESLWHYVLLKLVFLGAILDPSLHDISTWASVLAVSGFLKMSLVLARMRIQHLTQREVASKQQHATMVLHTLCVLVCNCGWGAILVHFFAAAGYSVLALLLFESVLVMLDGCHTIVVHLGYLLAVHPSYVYYADLLKEGLSLGAMLYNYLHMWRLRWSSGLSFTLLDVLLVVHLRHILIGLTTKITQHRKYVQAAQNMEAWFPCATQEELGLNADVCVICMEQLDRAKKLPCKHLFHSECLQSWLRHDSSCPTCRSHVGSSPATRDPGGEPGPSASQEEVSIFGFNGSVWGGWLSSCVEAFSAEGVPVAEDTVRHVQEMFPHISTDIVAQDLASTQNVDATIENMLGLHHDT